MSPRLTRPAHWLAFGLGAGLVPVAPGTFGTLVGVPVYLAMTPLPPLTYLAVTCALFLVGVWLCGATARDLGVHDHPGIVWDEIVGLLVTLAFTPLSWLWLLVGFVLFRLFDILKPWPVGLADRRVGGGLGIMLDDLLAGLYALASLQLLRYSFPPG